MNRLHQVFVSSTFRDLENERKKLTGALLEVECIPSGMELFPAADEDSWTLIKRVIDECDYYVLVLAGRYGSIHPSGLSYTEMEYNYASERGKPRIAFLHKHVQSLPQEKCEQTDAGRTQLGQFRARIEQERNARYWDSEDSLVSAVITGVSSLKRTRPAEGWVRGNNAVSLAVVNEAAELRRRVKELEGMVQRLNRDGPTGTEHLVQGKDPLTLPLRTYKNNRYVDEIRDWTSTWDEWFVRMGAYMFAPEGDSKILMHLNERVAEDIRESGVSVDAVAIPEAAYQGLKLQFLTLGYIEKVSLGTAVGGVWPVVGWTLTPYGERVLSDLVAQRREQP